MIPKANWTRLLAIAVALGAVAAGCGEDEPEVKKRAAQPRGTAPPPAAAAAAVGGPSVQTYSKIEDALRRTFLEKDFRPDSTGDKNRDPFRSYIVRQPGTRDETTKRADGENEVCRNTKTKKNWQAPTYSIRDLTLIGIIMRGTTGYAQFLDNAGEGWIVTQGNCMGVEKAIVGSIGAGVVRLQVRPDAPLGGTAPPPVAKDIPLYPEEYEIDATDLDGKR